jgi:anti-sigma B factor antagonist
MEGRLDTQTSPDAEKELQQITDNGATKLVVDFGELDYISSTGLRILLATAKRLKSEEGEMRLCGLNAVVNKVFQISGFAKIFSIFPTESEALENF